MTDISILKIYFAGIILALTINYPAFAQENFNRAFTAGGENADKPYSCLIDDRGYSYLTGSFSATADFGDISLQSKGNADAFVALVEPDGNYTRCFSFGGNSNDYAVAIGVDSDYNIIIAGNFSSDTLFFCGGNHLIKESGQDFFIIKISPYGELFWAKSFGNIGNDAISDIQLDSYDNIYAAGTYNNFLDLGNNKTITTNGGQDVFLIKLNADGQCQWAKTIGGSTSLDYSTAIACNGSGVSYIAGRFNGSIYFPDGVDGLTSTGSSDIFIAKFNYNGACQAAEKIGGTSSDFATSIDIDQSNNIYIGGYFLGTIVFNDAISLASAGGTDGFTAKYNSQFECQWARKAGGSSSDGVNSISVDDSGNISSCGYFAGQMQLSDGILLTGAGSTDAFFVSYDPEGAYLSSYSIGGTGSDEAISIFSTDKDLMTGSFSNTVTIGDNDYISQGSSDIFGILSNGSLPELAAPDINYPQNDELEVNLPASFSWQSTSSAEDYDLQVSIRYDFDNTAIDVENIAATFYEASSLADNRIYFWRLRAGNSTENSLWTPPIRFITEESIPEDISLISPEDNSVIYSMPVLEWDHSDAATSYFIQLSDDPEMDNIIYEFSNIAENQLPIHNIEYDKTYYWRVKAGNSDFSSDWSNLRSFTLRKQFPSAPQLISPYNYQISDQEITLVWSSVLNSDKYQLQVATDPEFKSPIYNDSTIEDTEKQLLLKKDEYFWRVRSILGENKGFWQQAGVFSITSPIIPFASGGGGDDDDAAYDVSSDSLGNVYLTGYFSSDAILSDSISIVSNGGKDIFLVRYDSRGNCIWARSAGSSGDDLATAVINDDSGNIFIGGAFSGTVSFDDNTELASNGGEDVFIAKYDSSGSFIWAKSFGSIALDRLTGMKSHDGINISISGYYSDTLIVDPDLDTLFSSGTSDIFLARLDSSGSFEWAKGFGNEEFDQANGIAVDNNGSIYLTGFFADEVDFGDFTIESAGEEDIFISKFDDQGNCLWARSAGSVSGSDNASAITCSPNGNIYLTGSYSSTIHFSDTDSLVSSGTRDAFFVSYDTNGNHVWSFSGGGNGLIDTGNDIEYATNGNVYSLGTFAFTAIFDNKAILKSLGSSDVFILEISPEGDIKSAKSIGGSYSENGYGLGVDVYSNVYGCGSFKRTAYFNGNSLTSRGENDIFLSMVFGIPSTKLLLPENESSDISVKTHFEWEDAVGREFFRLQIFKDESLEELFEEIVNISDTTYNSIFLSPVTDYFWRVQASNGEKKSPWSPVFSFKTEFEIPTLVSPEDSSFAIDTDPELVWSNVRLSDAYELEVSRDQSFVDLILSEQNAEDNNYHLSNLDNSTEYFWRVRAKNDEYISDWSEIFRFTTYLETPELITPENNATKLNTELVFNWEEIEDADRYVLIIAEDASFNDQVYENDIISSNNAFIDVLEPDKSYWWKVKAVSDNNESKWSEAFNLTTYISTPGWWEFSDNTGYSAEVVLPQTATIKVRRRSILPGDGIGVFYTNEDTLKCAGFGVWNDETLNITVWGDDPETSIKDGFSNNEDFSFKFWDAQNGTEILAEATFRPGDPDHFVNGETSYIFSLNSVGAQTQYIDLTEGWNMISSYVVPEDSLVESVFSEIEADMLVAKDINGNLYFPSLNINTIGSWNFKRGYKMYMTDDTELEISGYAAVPEENPIELLQGWNLVSYLRQSEMSVLTVFAEISENVLIVKDNDGNIYMPSLNINTIGNMQLGQGYMIYANQQCTLEYPANSLPKMLCSQYQDFTTRDNTFTNTGDNSTLIIKLKNIENAAQLQIFNQEDMIVGKGKAINGISVITLWGDNDLTKEKDGAIKDEDLFLRIIDTKGMLTPYEINNIYNLTTGKSVQLLKYNSHDVILMEVQDHQISSKMKLMPNPAGNSVLLEYNSTKLDFIQVYLYDAQGNKVKEYQFGNSFEGKISEKLDLHDVSSGIYSVVLKAGNSYFRDKLIIMK